MAYVRIQNLNKTFGETRILTGLSLDIEAGNLISLLGLSGSGKTTALRCLAGLERPDESSGVISVGGRVLSGPGPDGSAIFLKPEHRELGMVFQNYAVWPHMNVFENVAFPLRIKKKAIVEAEIISQVNGVLEMVKMSHLGHRFPHELSGGQQQRVALARALVCRPQVLLLDEPLSNLDAILREELGSEIRRLQQELKLTTILVTHDQREALSLSDRVVVLNQGKIEAQGAPEELVHNPPTPFLAQFLGGAQTLLVPEGTRTVLPRRWSVVEGGTYSARIQTRLFLGSEYEYLGDLTGLGPNVRFFSRERFEVGARVGLRYSE
jgi:iron(III) transport system ATP-binding protein